MPPSPLRLEDARLLTGRGRFVDDLRLPGEAHAWMVRSPHAHARVRGIDTDAARAVPGVLAVYTGADVAAAGLGTLPCRSPVRSRDGSDMRAPARPLLVSDAVRYVGDSVAMVVAETRDAAHDAAELVEVDYEELPADADLAHGGEQCFDWEKGDAAAVEAAFARAARVCRIETPVNRVAVSPIETRGAIGVFEPDGGRFTLYTQTQGVHLVRSVFAEVLGIGLEDLRVVTPDVGGSFGMKLVAYPEQGLVLFAARALGRPVRWSGERSDAFLTDTHGRDHFTRAELALDAEGRFLGMRATVRANLGAYLSTVGPMIPTDALAKVFGHVYAIPALHLRVQGMITHTTPLDAYRGAGKPEIEYVVERLIDRTAREIGVDRVELRRRNLVPAAAMPYRTAFGLVWDVGDFEAVLDAGLAAADWAGFEARRRASEAAGRLRGRGVSLYLHATGGSTTELSRVELTGEGRVRVYTGTQSSGQGHETAFAQIVARRLEIPIERIDVVQGDTAALASGGGTGGSSSLPIGATTIDRATVRFLDRARELAGATLEAAAADLEYGAGRFRVAGTDLGISLLELGSIGEGRGGCVGEATFEGENQTCPNGAYLAEVEVDPETGRVHLAAFTTVDDLGTLLNPPIALGQVHGGVVQAIGQALLEEVRYDPETGQLLSGSFMDYGLPRADDVPAFVSRLVGEPSPSNPLGMKGVGEVGNIGGCGAVIGAVTDAIGHEDIEMPATPERVWRALERRS